MNSKLSNTLLINGGRLSGENKGATFGLPRKLSPQQTAVLTHVIRGLADKEIAEGLGISEETVGWHMKRIFKLYGVHSRTALVCCWWSDQKNRAHQSPPHVRGAGKDPLCV